MNLEQFPPRSAVSKNPEQTPVSSTTENFSVSENIPVPIEAISGIPDVVISQIFAENPRFGQIGSPERYREYVYHNNLTSQLVTDPNQESLMFPDQYDHTYVMGDDADLAGFTNYMQKHYSQNTSV
jgi:hypothetical protein